MGETEQREGGGQTKMRKGIVEGEAGREEAENRKHSVCKLQIKSVKKKA